MTLDEAKFWRASSTTSVKRRRQLSVSLRGMCGRTLDVLNPNSHAVRSVVRAGTLIAEGLMHDGQRRVGCNT